MFLVSSRTCLCPIHWSQVLSWEWRCRWSSADRQCSNYIWVINNLLCTKVRHILEVWHQCQILYHFLAALAWHEWLASEIALSMYLCIFATLIFLVLFMFILIKCMIAIFPLACLFAYEISPVVAGVSMLSPYTTIYMTNEFLIMIDWWLVSSTSGGKLVLLLILGWIYKKWSLYFYIYVYFIFILIPTILPKL